MVFFKHFHVLTKISHSHVLKYPLAYSPRALVVGCGVCVSRHVRGASDMAVVKDKRVEPASAPFACDDVVEVSVEVSFRSLRSVNLLLIRRIVDDLLRQ